MENDNEQTPNIPNVAPEHLAAFVELRKELLNELKEQAQEERDKADTMFAISQQSIGFFEKLTVLDGGTFALSLTLLSALSSHIHHPAPPGLNLGWLYAAWICLLLSIVMCLVHNNMVHAQASTVHSMALSNTIAARHTIQQVTTTNLSRLMSGTVQVDGKVIDLKDMFVNLGKALNDSRIQQNKLQFDLWPKVQEFEKTARHVGAVAVWLTWIALLLILVFAMRTGYVLLLPA